MDRVAGVPVRTLATGAFERAGDRERDLERDRDRDLSEKAWDWEKDRPRDREETTLSRSSRSTGSRPIDWAAALRKWLRSSSSSGGRGGGAEISMTSENTNGFVGGGGRPFLLLLRWRVNGSAMPEGMSRLPRARFGRAVRALGWGEEGEEGDEADEPE